MLAGSGEPPLLTNLSRADLNGRASSFQSTWRTPRIMFRNTITRLPELEGLNDLRYFDVDAFRNVKELDLSFEGPSDMFEEFGNN